MNNNQKCGCCNNGYIKGKDAFGKPITLKCKYCDEKGNIKL
jgi:hypothetical protein